MTDTQIITQDGWTMRARAGSIQAPHHLFVLLHGWTGNEDVMWVFARQLSPDDWIISPRGPVNAPDGGFGWFPTGDVQTPALPDLQPLIEQLLGAVDRWSQSNHIAATPLTLMGFSQGAILAYAIALLSPQRINGVAALAGYLPEKWMGSIKEQSLGGKPFYLAHGTKDDTVPVAFARETVRFLETAGARVTYCESEVGHKLSLDCLHGLEKFFLSLSDTAN